MEGTVIERSERCWYSDGRGPQIKTHQGDSSVSKV